MERATLPARTAAGLGSRAEALGCRVFDLRVGVWGLGLRVEDSGSRVYM